MTYRLDEPRARERGVRWRGVAWLGAMGVSERRECACVAARAHLASLLACLVRLIARGLVVVE